MLLASIESFIGSVWFGVATFVVGYVVGHIFSVDKLKKIFVKE